jgi:uncharacterized protein with PIN domain
VSEYIYLFFDQPFGFLLKEPETRVNYLLDRRASIKDIIEALGVPHTEVGKLSLGQEEIDFDYLPEGGEKIDVLAHTPPVDVTQPTKLRPDPLPEVKFIVDGNIGKLAMLLRMMGIDTLFDPEFRDKEITFLAHKDGRIVLSKDRSLLKRKDIIYGHLVQALDPDSQLKEIVHFFGLKPKRLFSRCLRCNELLQPIAKEKILHLLEPKTKKYFFKFYHCPGCGKIYWQGSHWDRMKERLEKIGIEVEEDK